MMQKCKELWRSHRAFVLLLAAELIFLAVHLGLALQVQEPVTFSGADLIPKMSDAFWDENGGLAMEDGQEYGVYASTPIFSLKKGSYKISVTYQSDLEGGQVRQENHYVTCNDARLSTLSNGVSFSAWARGNTATSFDFTYNGGYRSILSFTATPTRAWARTSTLGWLLGLALLDLLWLLWRGKLPTQRLDYRTRLIWAGLGCTVLFLCLPLCTDYLFSGHDLTYHLARIQGLADGLADGQFPVRIHPSLLQGNGYANGVFYGELFLYFPAVLRLLGFSLQACYKMYLAAVNLGTVLVSYWCFCRILGSRTAALAGSALYALSVYRLCNIYVRAAVGEYTAMLFFPLIVYALWRIFTQDPSTPGYSRSWVPGVVGYSGLILSHILSCELAAIFTVIVCLICIKKVLRPQTFVALAKIVLVTALICLWFLVPFADYLFTGDFRINSGGSTIWSSIDYSTFVAQLFNVFANGGGVTLHLVDGMASEMPLAIGPALTLGSLLFLVLLLEPGRGKTPLRTLGLACLLLGGLAQFMSTDLFPWFELSELCAPLGTMISKLQFTWRFLALAALFWALCSGAGLVLLRRRFPQLLPAVGSVLFCTLFLCSGFFYYNLYNGNSGDHHYDLVDLSARFDASAYGELCAQISGAEYLPSAVDQDVLWTLVTPDYDPSALTLTDYSKNGLHIRMNAQNSSSTEQALTLPLLHYKGYTALDGSGQALPVTQSATGQLCVTVPAGYTGSIAVDFVPPWYWRLCEGVSLATLLGLAAWGLALRRSKQKQAALAQ